MGHPITLQLADDAHRALLQSAERTGRTPEELAAAWLTDRLRQIATNPLLQWSGAFDSVVKDAAERHDEYIGQALAKEIRGERNE
jgi:hypothetical protein